jgi:hypothetical protein
LGHGEVTLRRLWSEVSSFVAPKINRELCVQKSGREVKQKKMKRTNFIVTDSAF